MKNDLRIWLFRMAAAFVGIAPPDIHASDPPPDSAESIAENQTPAETAIAAKSGSSSMQALSGMRGMGGSGGPGYSLTWMPSRPVVGTTEDVSVLRQSLNLGAPIWRAEGEMLLLNTGLRSTMYSTEAVLPVSRRQIPEQLWSVTVGTMFMHQFDNGWSGGAMINAGSSGDKPFNSWKELNGTLLAFLGVPSGEKIAWLFSLMYSPLSEIPFPIPGIAYSWFVDETLQLSLGIPFRVTWKPHPDVYVETSYMPVTTVHFQTGWKMLGGPFTIFGGYDWANEAYQLSDRAAHKDRFFSYAMTVSAGLRYAFPKYGTIELLGGYAFDRFVFIGRGFSDRHNDRLDFESGPFVSASFRLRF